MDDVSDQDDQEAQESPTKRSRREDASEPASGSTSEERGSGASSGSTREEPRVTASDSDQRAAPSDGDQIHEEGISAKMARRKHLPSAEEIRQHNVSHIPYRNLCPHCVAGRGKAHPHRSHEYQREVPVIGMDFFYFVSDQDESQQGC